MQGLAEEFRAPAPEDSAELPLRVRNTFIDVRLARSPSLEAFYKERTVSSCPSSPRGCCATGEDADAGKCSYGTAATTPTPTSPLSEDPESPAPAPARWRHAGWGSCSADGARAALASAHHAAAAPQWQPAPAELSVCWGGPIGVLPGSALQQQQWGQPDAAAPCPPSPEPAFGATRSGRKTVSLAAALPVGGGERGDSRLPSAGSALHDAGRCKPCAFVHSRGCGSGVDCEFCHLCEPGEKKRRKKERQAVKRETRVARGPVPLAAAPRVM